jgi:hypothetical protein
MENKFQFDSLRYLHTVSDDELRIIFKNPESQKGLRQLIECLGDEKDKKEIISQETFPDLVHRMHNRMVDGSKMLGWAIIESGDYSDEGKIADAIQILKEFIQKCPSEFYINIAKARLKDLEK